MKFIFQVESKSNWLLGLEDNSNRDCGHIHTPSFKLKVVVYIKQLSPHKPRKTNKLGRRGNVSKHHFCVLKKHALFSWCF